jgi:hypothetical protein
MQTPGDFFPPSNGGMQKPGDFFPGFPGGSTDSTNNRRPGGDGGFGGRPSDGGFGGSGSGSKGDAIDAFNRDQVTRTEYTFNDAVDKFKALGQQNEVSLELQMRDWLGQQNSKNPLTFMRGTAVIADGLGQFRLGAGSRIDLTSHQDTKPRILQGYDYDFGGEATTWLRMAAGSLVEGQQYVRGHKGLVIDGQSMDDAYLNQLKNLQTGVETNLNKVYGAHDVNGVYNEVRNQVRVNAGDWQQGLVRLQRQLDGLRSTDNRFISKSARDVALGYLAEADYMSTQNNGEDAKIMYQSANKYLNLAMQKDASAPDNYALQNISAKLRPQIEKAIDNQWSDPFGNPFNIPKPANSFVV